MWLLILSSSPFLFVFGDDRVFLYTGAVDDTGDAANTWDGERAILGILS